MDPGPDPAIFVTGIKMTTKNYFFALLLFGFSKIKSHKEEVTKQ
jgi:hypothetical protein